MINDDDARSQVLTLIELGLTVTQARVYLTLVKSKNLTAQKISVLSTVSRPDVYRVLNQLQQEGFVERLISKPEEFQAISIKDGISLLLEKRNKKTEVLQELGQRLIQTVRKVEDLEIEGEKTKSEFIFIPSKASAYGRSKRMIEAIEKDICFLGLAKRMGSWLSLNLDNMENALSRKIDCRLIMSDSGMPNQFGGLFRKLKRYPNFKIRKISSPKGSFSIWDNKEILITTSTSDMLYSSGTLWSRNKGLIDMCADYFECLWERAEESNPKE